MCVFETLDLMSVVFFHGGAKVIYTVPKEVELLRHRATERIHYLILRSVEKEKEKKKTLSKCDHQGSDWKSPLSYRLRYNTYSSGRPEK